MKRQRGRGRGKPGGNHGNQGNRSFESNGPEVKIRGNAATIYEKYMQLARDATSSGDRVRAENLQQHAEHYFRILQLTQPQRRDNSNSNDDDDSDDNSNDDGDDNNNRNDNRNQNQNRGRGRQDNNRSRNNNRDDNNSRDDDDSDDDNQDDNRQSSRNGNNNRDSSDNRDSADNKPKRAPRQPRRPSPPQRDPLEVVNPEGEQPSIAAQGDGGEEQPKPKARRGRKPKVAEDGADAAQQALDKASKKADSRKSTSDEAA